jgi:hypothetical protein
MTSRHTRESNNLTTTRTASAGTRRRTLVAALAAAALVATALGTAPSAYSQEDPPSGEAYGLAADVGALGITLPPSPAIECPPDGNALDSNVDLEGVVTIDLIEIACETDDAGVFSAVASLAGLAIDTGVPGVPPASADLLEAFCTADGDDLSGGVNIVNVMIGEEAIEITGEPNQTVPLPNPLGLPLNIVFNRQIEGDGELTVQALYLDAAPLGFAVAGSVTCRTGAAGPPVTEPPVTEPPVTEPPDTEPPDTEPPAEEPPTETPVPPTPPGGATPVTHPPTYTG